MPCILRYWDWFYICRDTMEGDTNYNYNCNYNYCIVAVMVVIIAASAIIAMSIYYLCTDWTASKNNFMQGTKRDYIWDWQNNNAESLFTTTTITSIITTATLL